MMKKYSFLKSSLSILRANRMNAEQLHQLQQRRYKEMIQYARTHSPLFGELYKDLGEEPKLEDLPVTTKGKLMRQFDQWVTDPAITLDRAKEYMKDYDNIGRRIDDKYLICQTSGSTGIPCTVVKDKNSHNVTLALGEFRTFTHIWDFVKAVFRGAKLTQICFKEFSLEYNQLRHQLLRSPMQKHRVMNIDLNEDLALNVAKLNRFQPSIMSAYPNAMRILIPEMKAGRLKIQPNLLITGGEILTDAFKAEIEQVMKTRVLDAYGSTESGIMAFMCKEGHMHVNSDWVILEPVDEEYNPVPPGVQSQKILITNLSNFVQPFIRYEVTDRVILYDEPCKCGSHFPMIKVEGRTSDILDFISDNGRVSIIPMKLNDAADFEGIIKFQLVQKDPHHLEVRLLCEEDADREALYKKTEENLLEVLSKHGVRNVEIRFSEELPKNDFRGKFKQVFSESAAGSNDYGK